jgi:hypothetical protein
MGKHVTILQDKLCSICSAIIQRIHLKNPFIDDFEDECSNTECSDHGSALKRLNTSARAIARRENETNS